MDPLFTKYSKLFNENGFRLYMVGGSTRDFLLEIPFSDYDFVSDATPEEMRRFLPNADYAFAKFGSVKVFGEQEVDITTLREEGKYDDKRHPNFIKFIKDPKLDVVRRDFTINALYIDEEGHVLDYVNGLEDLHNGVIRFIGDPEKRVQEDPLRILRGERFAKKLGFVIEPKSLEAMNRNRDLLVSLNPEKIKMELSKETK